MRKSDINKLRKAIKAAKKANMEQFLTELQKDGTITDHAKLEAVLNVQIEQDLRLNRARATIDEAASAYLRQKLNAGLRGV